MTAHGAPEVGMLGVASAGRAAEKGQAREAAGASPPWRARHVLVLGLPQLSPLRHLLTNIKERMEQDWVATSS